MSDTKLAAHEVYPEKPETETVDLLAMPGAVNRVKRTQLHCQKCGHRWFPRDPARVPEHCSNCKNSRWWLPKTPGAERRGRKKKIVDAEV